LPLVRWIDEEKMEIPQDALEETRFDVDVDVDVIVDVPRLSPTGIRRVKSKLCDVQGTGYFQMS
jgi:hypothetical protein